MIRYFTLSDSPEYSLSDITSFNNLCFPIRGNHDKYDNYRIVDNPFTSEQQHFIYGATLDNKIIAQILMVPVPLSSNGKITFAFWGQDYFVLEKYRGDGIGKELTNLYLNNNHFIAVGFSHKSAIIHQKKGTKKIGYLDFYRKWASPFHRVKFLLQRGLKLKAKQITAYQFPDNIDNFTRVKHPEELHLPEINWNKDVIESLRNEVYFRWRFFYKQNRYFVYQSQKSAHENAVYFVAKPYFYKGVNWLKVVDYRFNNLKSDDFNQILKSVEKLRKKLNLYGVLISSSQKISNDILSQKHFKQYKHEMILTTYPFSHESTEEAHNHIIISFADTDLDMHTNLGKFNYAEDY